MIDREPKPLAIEPERVLLGGLLREAGQLLAVRAELAPSDFNRPDHAQLYQLMLSMIDEGRGVDVVTVAERAQYLGADRFGGLSYIAELPDHCVSTVNLHHYAAIVLEHARVRRLRAVSAALLEAADGHGSYADMPAGEIADEWIPRLAELALVRGAKKYSGTLADYWTAAENDRLDREAGSKNQPLTTGFHKLDELITCRPGDLVVIGGEASMGKSALAQAFALHFGTQHGFVYYHSLEMPGMRIARRFAANVLEIGITQLTTGDLTGDEEADRDRFTADLHAGKWNIHLNERPGVSMEQVATEARALWSRGGLRAVFVDHLHLMKHPKRESRTVSIGETTSQAKQLALELEVPVFLLSQLNRTAARRPDPRGRKGRGAWWDEVAQPQLSDLRESGAIEQDADIVLFPIHAAHYGLKDAAKYGAIIVAKQRDGALGVVDVDWDGPCAAYRPPGTLPLKPR